MIDDVWVVEHAIGKGGMGSVYRCHNRRAVRILAAIKTLEPAVRDVAGAEERFIREAEILSSLDHRNVVKVKNVRLDIEMPYIEMEFVEGRALSEILRDGPVSPAQAVDWMEQLLDALVYLHDKGIRHRDLKPANLIVAADDRLRVVDFGLAMEADTARITAPDMKFGTVAYAPPEWLYPERLDPASWDIYAAGVIFWQLLTGKEPFPPPPGASARLASMKVMGIKQGHDPLDPGEPIPPHLRELVREMTHSDQEKRTKSAAAALDRLRALRVALGLPILRRPTGSPVTETPTPPSEAPTLPPLPDPTPPPMSPVVRGMWLGGATIVIATAIVATSAWLAAAWDRPGHAEVLITGVPQGVDLVVEVAGEPPKASKAFRYTFDHVGDAFVVDWAVGSACGADQGCPGLLCPAWCAQGRASATRDPATGIAAVEIAPPRPRAVSITVRGSGPRPLRAHLASAPAAVDGATLRFEGVVPGRYPLRVEVGACPEAAAGCDARGDCPEGCRSVVDPVFVVPVGDGAHTVSMTVAPPPVAPALDGRSVANGDDPADPQHAQPLVPSSSSDPVTRREYATWLKFNPVWMRTAPLKGWTGTGTPRDAEERVVSVSWLAADAFCRDRGGLAPVDALPHTWVRSETQPANEWRVRDGVPAIRREDGTTEDLDARSAEGNATTGFRCAR